MKEPHEKGVAIRSAPSFAPGVAKCPAKRKQGRDGLGIELRKSAIRVPTLSVQAEGNMTSNVSASCWLALRSRRPHAHLEIPCTRTGRPRRCLKRFIVTGRRVKARAVRPACTSSRSRTAEQYL